jgi:hypothetical protein
LLRKKSDDEVHTQLRLGYGKDALCHCTRDKWAARFWNGRTSVEDDERPGRPSSDGLSDAVSDYLNRNPHASCREIAKDLCIPMTAILRALDEMGLRFVVARRVAYRLWPELKVKRIETCREILEILEELGPRQKITLLQRMNAGFTGIIIISDNE